MADATFTLEALNALKVSELRTLARQKGAKGAGVLYTSKENLVQFLLTDDASLLGTKSPVIPQPTEKGDTVIVTTEAPKAAPQPKRTLVIPDGKTIYRDIKTKLVGREEMFRILALGETLQLPVLFVGGAGIGKSQGILDYAASMNGANAFISQLSVGTRPAELKGYVDLQSLVAGKEYKTFTPITDADVILIDEVEKGSSEIRNILLSIMRERELQLGSEGVRKCHWRLFAGSANMIPPDEVTLPFWDRFVVKHVLKRVNVETFASIWKREDVTVRVPVLNGNLDDIEVDMDMLLTFAKMAAPKTTDRTMTAFPRILKGIMGVWEIGLLRGLLKLGEFVLPHSDYESVMNEIIPSQVRATLTMLTALKHADGDTRKTMLAEAKSQISQARGKCPSSLKSDFNLMVNEAKIND